MAIENARLYEAAQSRGEWLQASAAITRELLAADVADPRAPLATIAELGLRLAAADNVAVLLPMEEGGEELSVEVAVGDGADTLSGLSVPFNGTVAGRVFLRGEPLRITSRNEVGGVGPPVADAPDLGPLLVLPLLGSHRVHGVLTVGRLSGRPSFSEEDLQMASGFANQAALAIELAEARAERQRALMFEERDRIAADLHDHVIQRLFAAGLSLQAVAAVWLPDAPPRGSPPRSPTSCHLVSVDVSAGVEAVSLPVLDDGRGMPDRGRRSGLSNMRRRAEREGGTFTIAPREPARTVLCWSVPTRSDAQPG